MTIFAQNYMDKTENTPIVTSENLGWSPGFFEKTSGSWVGEPLVREPQPETQERDPLPKNWV